MSAVNRNKLRALATGCRDEVIRSHGWEGTIEGAELIGRDRRLLMELSPEVVIQLLDDYDALAAAHEQAWKSATSESHAWAREYEARMLVVAERDRLREELAAIRGQEPVAYVSAEAVGGVCWRVGLGEFVFDDRAPLYALPPQQPTAPTDTQRLDFILRKHRQVVAERLPGNRLEVYVAVGFMGEEQHPAITHHGEWDEGSPEAAALKRQAIDLAIRATTPAEGTQ